MSNIVEYILRINSNVEETLTRIGITNELQIATWTRLEQQVDAANATMATMGNSFDFVKDNAAALRTQIAWIPEGSEKAIQQITQFFQQLDERITSLTERVLNAVEQKDWAFRLITNSIKFANNAYKIYEKMTKIIASWSKIITKLNFKKAKALWVVVKPMLIMTAKISLIIAAIVSLAAAIIYCVKHVTGWRETWSNVMEYMGLGIRLFRNVVSLAWLKIKNTFISGFEQIEKGWHRIQSLWNRDSAQAGLARLEAQRNERLKEIAAAKEKVDEVLGQMSEMSVWQLTNNGVSFRDFVGGAINRLGVNSALQNSVGDGAASAAAGSNLGTVGASTNQAIATGGTRNTTVNISVGNMIENVSFSGTVRENVREIERNFAECLHRVLGMANMSAG